MTPLKPRYDGGDHLHFAPAGNRALASAVKVSLLLERDLPRDARADLR